MRQLTVKILWLGVLCTGLASVPAFSQGLGTLVELARKNDPQWLLANAKFRESQEYLPQAYSQLLPSVSFTSNSNKVQQQLTNGATESPEQRYPSSSKVLSLRQPIFRSKQMFGVNSAKAQTEQAAFYFQEETQQVTLRVVDAYLNLLLANDRKVFLESQKELVNTRLKAAMAGLRAGQGMRTDVDEAQAELSKIVADAKAAVARVMAHFAAQAPVLDHTDGISADFGDWRFNLRSSNTEPLLRLNVEARGDAGLMQARTDEISHLLQQ